MTRVLGALDLIFGFLFGAIALIALRYLPIAYDRIAVEREDFYLRLILFFASALFSVAAASVGWVLVRRRFFWKVSIKIAAFLSATLSIVLALVSLIGFTPDDPTSREFRLLMIPSALFGVSFLFLMRMRREQDS